VWSALLLIPILFVVDLIGLIFPPTQYRGIGAALNLAGSRISQERLLALEPDLPRRR
jgi:hypothetical protein